MSYPTVTLARQPTLWPDRTVAKLAFTDYVNVTLLPVATTWNSYYYRANCPYDPIAAGAGDGMVPGLDEYGTLYTKYRVLASSCLVQVVTTDVQPCFAVLCPYTANSDVAFNINSDSLGPNGVKQAASNPYAKSKVISYTSSGTTTSRTLYQYITLEKLTGDTGPLTDATWVGATGSGPGAVITNPANKVHWYIGGCQLAENNVTSTAGVQMLVRVTYWVEFFARDFENTYS